MFLHNTNTNRFVTGARLLERIYYEIVRSVRQKHRNAFVALLLNILQAVVFMMVFYVLFSLLGLRKSAVRGDFMLYIMSGIFLFLTHVRVLGAVAGSDGATSAMMKHAPMNTLIAISSSAMGVLYIQVLTLASMLFFYHSVITPIEIHQPIYAFGMLLVAWFSGVAVGMVFYAIKPWAPGVIGIVTMLYMRANMLASGKMFLVNNLPANRRSVFDWNPLFHAIDQARGFTFINYNPHYTTISYPLILSVVLLLLGLMGEFFTRKHVSLSWTAGK